MKRKVIYTILVIIIVFILTGCGFKTNNINKLNEMEIKDKLNKEMDSVKVIIDNKEYKLNLEDNETTKSFINILPKTWKMNELNGNEKYIYLDTILPTNSSNPEHINSGDVMLYGNNCLVIFYKSFDTSYNYTKIGHIDNLDNLGNDSITAKFEK